MQDFVYLKENLDNLYLAERNLTTEGGRLLSFMRNEGGIFSDEKMFKWYASPTGGTTEQIASELAKKGYTPDTIKKMARDIRLNKDNLGAVAQAAHSVKPGSWFNVFNEFRINNMLSGPFTLAANAATNGLKTLLMPAEKYLAGTIMRDDAVQREALDTFSGLFRYWNDSFRLAKKAWKVEDNILDRMGGKMETNSAAMTYENIRNLMLKDAPKGAELSPLQENIARAMGLVGPYLRIPSRLLMSTDEFFKQLNYRSSLSASLLREGREAGIKDAGELARYVEEQLALAFKKDGSAIRGRYVDDAVKDSIQYARESTWTQDLGRNTLGGGIPEPCQHPPRPPHRHTLHRDADEPVPRLRGSYARRRADDQNLPGGDQGGRGTSRPRPIQNGDGCPDVDRSRHDGAQRADHRFPSEGQQAPASP